VPPDWDVEADVVVVGFGAAGACAALEAAAAGCSVVILDRFGGGGATALSGGVVYAGGGTAQQRAAGVTDTPDAMLGYLRTEVGPGPHPRRPRRRPRSGQVLRPDGRPGGGLYAAGRTAAGLCSRSYVSGLSLADCVFSGRRAGRHAAGL